MASRKRTTGKAGKSAKEALDAVEELDEVEDAELEEEEETTTSTSPALKLPTAPEDYVEVAMLQSVSPPTVGNWDGMMQLGVQVMEAKQAYQVPAHVAEHMEDCKLCIKVSK